MLIKHVPLQDSDALPAVLQQERVSRLGLWSSLVGVSCPQTHARLGQAGQKDTRREGLRPFLLPTYLQDVVQGDVPEAFPGSRQNVGGFFYFMLLISLDLGIFHEGIFLFFTDLFKLFLGIFELSEISKENKVGDFL